MNAVRTFIDSNILIYAFSADEPVKQKKAFDCLNNCIPVISTQVIKEFANVIIKKFKFDPINVSSIIHDIPHIAEIVREKLELIIGGLRIKQRYGYSFYDGLIIATALHANCRILLSEDLQDNHIIDGKLRIINPFISV
ncbi:MAG: PIN domain-containing protein [Defluviitaleaceae bacterium]|nr:PIN domain-containing protein [Defluviitaleaceae bacterium]